MRLYPDVPRKRLAVALRDVLIAVLLFLFAQVALAVLAVGVQRTGNAVEGGFGAAADAVDGTPVVGGELADALRGAGAGTGGEVAGLGESGEHAIRRLADK